MNDPVAAIAEAEATGEVAALYADIRAVYGVSVVNLVWRHLATIPGALPWAWETVRPLYLDGTIARQAAALRIARRLPPVVALPPEVLAAAGLDEADAGRIGDVLDAYERTNPMALIALSVALQRLADPASGGAAAAVPDGPPPPASPAIPLPAILLPALLRLEDMAPATAALVLRLNRIGAAGPDPVLASLYRNLAHWPGYLALAWTLLAPLEAGGVLGEAIGDVRAAARVRAAAIAGLAPRPRAVLAAAQRPAVEQAIGRFTGDAIARMVVLCGVLRAAGTGRGGTPALGWGPGQGPVPVPGEGIEPPAC